MKKEIFNSFGFSFKNLKKARYLIAENLRNVDIIYELIDARAPKTTKNSYIDRIISKKARIIIFSRADLADKEITKLWIKNFNRNGMLAFGVNCKKTNSAKIILDATRKLLSDIYKDRGRKNIIARKFRAMVVGVPNIGKSTLINSLAYRKKAKASNFPGITLGKQWIFIDDYIDILDTPGSLSFEDKNENDRYILDLIGCVKDGVYDVEEVAVFFIDFLRNNYKGKFFEIFKEKNNLDGFKILNQFAKDRLFFKKGTMADTKRAADFLVSSFRNKKFGRISLQLP